VDGRGCAASAGARGPTAATPHRTLAGDLAGHQPGLDRRGAGLYHLHVGAPPIDEEEAASAVHDKRGGGLSPFGTSNILTAATAI
jgi:hypothetical protein